MSRVIVSLTTYPKRINVVHKVIKKILIQTILPDKVVLYISKEEFQDTDIPKSICNIKDDRFEIRYVADNIMAHKKYYYAFLDFPEDIIITVDDDIEYPTTLIEELLQYREQFPKAVLARRAHLIIFNGDKSIAKYGCWHKGFPQLCGEPRHDLCATNGGGSLFPPHIFGKELFNIDAIKKISLYADDLWLKVMELYYDIPIVVVNEDFKDKHFSQITDGLYSTYNQEKNDNQWENLIREYPMTYDGDSILDRVFGSNGVTICDLLEMLKQRLIDELSLELYGDGILLYGAGVMGKRFLSFMHSVGKGYQIKKIIVNDTSENDPEICGIGIANWREYVTDNRTIFLGIAEKSIQEVQLQLLNAGIDRRRIRILSDKEYHLFREIEALNLHGM